MRKSICHYSFHRRWKEENWTAERLALEVKALGVEGVDFHAGMLGPPAEAAGLIKAALDKSGRVLSGLSLSNNFNQEDAGEFKRQVATVKEWLAVGAAVGAPVMRIFGGHLADRNDPEAMATGRQRILDALNEVVQEAEKYGLTLALENHGGLPCTGEEQVEVIEQVNSPRLRATIDVGNYMQGGQEGHDGTRIAAKHAAYVHFKDFRKQEDSRKPGGWGLQACTIGQGDVDLPACIKALQAADYSGFIALEYEGVDAESAGVPASVEFMNKVIP